MDQKQVFRRKTEGFVSLEQQKRKRKIKNIIFYIALVVVFGGVFFALWFGVLFKVDNVEIKGNSRYSADQVIEAASISFGENLYSVSEEELKTKLTDTLPYIKDVSMNRKLPGTVEITVTEDKAVMATSIYGDTYLISNDLTVLERTDAKTDKIINVTAGDVRTCISGEKLSYVDTRMGDVLLTLYGTLEQYGIIDKITSFKIENRFDIYVCYNGKIDIYFGTVENIDIKVRFLVGILEHLYEDDAGMLDISNIKEATFSRYDS